MFRSQWYRRCMTKDSRRRTQSSKCNGQELPSLPQAQSYERGSFLSTTKVQRGSNTRLASGTRPREAEIDTRDIPQSKRSSILSFFSPPLPNHHQNLFAVPYLVYFSAMLLYTDILTDPEDEMFSDAFPVCVSMFYIPLLPQVLGTNL